MASLHLRELRPLPMSRWPTQGPVAKGVQLTLDGEVLTAMPTPLVEEYWVESYAKALLSGDLRVEITPAPSDALAQAMQEWAEMLLGNEENAQTAEAVQPKLEQAAEEEHIEFNSMADYYIAKVTADIMKTQPMDAESDNGTQDGSSSDSLFRPPAGDDLDIQQDLNEGANLDRCHYVNPHRDRDDEELQLEADGVWQNPMNDAPPEDAEQSSTVTVDFYLLNGQKKLLTKGAARNETKDSVNVNRLAHTDTCPDHKNKRWVMGVAPVSANPTVDLEALAAAITGSQLHLPFLVGRAPQPAEIILMFQCVESEKHKPKRIPLEQVQPLSFLKRGSQNLKVVETAATMLGNCAEVFTNLVVEMYNPDVVTESMTYEDTLSVVMPWGMEKFTAYLENARIDKDDGKTLKLLQRRCLTCQVSLTNVVKLRQDADEAIVTIDSTAQQKECPVPYADGATEYAKTGMTYYTWDNEREMFLTFTLEQFVNAEHLLAALLILGVGALGKSKLMHQIAQELCIAQGLFQYIFLKAIDPLGVLSHSGELRKAGCLCLTDFDFSASRGKAFGSEALKSLLDVPEGGTIKDTRWRPANFRKGLPRLLALNGSPGNYGKWFAKHDQYGIGIMVDALAAVGDGNGTMEQAAMKMRDLDSDAQAAARRVLVGIATQKLVTTETVQALREDTSATAQKRVAARAAYWAARRG